MQRVEGEVEQCPLGAFVAQGEVVGGVGLCLRFGGFQGDGAGFVRDEEERGYLGGGDEVVPW